MAGEPNTAEKQNEIRREVKRRRGKGSKKSTHGKSTETNFKFHVYGSFSEETKELISKRFRSKPEEPITTEWFRNVLKNNSITVDLTDSPIEKAVITSNGIKSVGTFDIDLFSVTVFTSGGFGVKFKTLKGQNRVIVV